MKFITLPITLVFVCLFGIYGFSLAQIKTRPGASKEGTNLMNQNKFLLFEENKGQLLDENRNPVSDVKFYGHSNGVNLYCKPGMVSFIFTKVEKDKKISEATGQQDVENSDPLYGEQPERTTVSTSRMDFVLVNSNPTATISATDQQEYYENFYTTGDADHGITNVHTYKTITYASVYPHIDLILKTAGQGMEYSFLVHPGGNMADIQLRWDGADNNKKSTSSGTLKNPGIEYSCPLGNVEETDPESFVNGKEVQSRFNKIGKNYGFKVGGYDKSKDLLIDPTLRWATYFGGSGADYPQSVHTDTSANVYITGITSSTNGIATSGAYQTSYIGNNDVFLAKFSSTGSLSWATYYGGTGDDEASGVVADVPGNVFITGRTNSSNMIATSGAYQISNISNPAYGYYTAFLAKFSANGVLSWSTYYGGSNNNEAHGVSTDGSGNVYITGSTTSSSGIASPGTYQTSFGGYFDAFLAKFSSSGDLSWATYFGGSGADNGAGISTDASGNVYITGNTTSISGIATSGAYQTSNAYVRNNTGGQDAFLAKFSGSGGLKWATYYGGPNEEDANGISIDGSDNVFISGNTQSASGIATSGAYQTSFGGGGGINAYLAKFSSLGTLSWATYYPVYYYGAEVSTDVPGNAYLAGNYFLAKFSSTGALSWNSPYSYYSNGVKCVSTDILGNIYVAGRGSIIATSGAYQTSNAGGYGFLVKFDYHSNDAGVVQVKPDGTFCSGTQIVKATIKNFGVNTLTSVKISWKVNGVLQKPYNWIGTLKWNDTITTNIGNFYFSSLKDTVVAWTSDPNTVNDSILYNDTGRVLITVNPLPKAITGNDTSICIGNNVAIGSSAVSGDTYSWSSNPAGFSSSSSNSNVKPAITTTYRLIEKNIATGCSNADSIRITVNPLPVADAGSNRYLPLGTSTTIGSTAVANNTYSWSSNPSGFSSTSAQPVVNPIVTTTYSERVVNTATGCANSSNVVITSTNGFLTMEMDTAMNTFDTLHVKVFVNSATNIYSLYARLNMKPDIFKLVSSAAGNFLGSSIIYTPSVANKGYIDFGITKQGKQGGSNGNGLFYSFTIVVQDLNFPIYDVKSLFTLDSIIAYDNVGNNILIVDSGGKYVDVHAHVDVWPGDLNNDKVVDVSDILPIGYFYNKTGPKRTSASLAWKAQSAPFWGNDKTNRNSPGWEVFSDANGDGIIGLADEAAIGLNMASSHSKRNTYQQPAIEQANSTAPTLTAIFPDTLIPHASLPAKITIPVNIGSSSVPVSNLLGVSFSLSFNPLYVNPSAISLDFSNSIFGVQGTDYIVIVDSDFANGKLNIGLTRFNTTPLNTYGNVVNFKLTVPANAPQGYFKLFAKVLSANDQNGNPIVVNSSIDSTHVMGVKGGVLPVLDKDLMLSIYPNPFSNKTLVNFTLPQTAHVKISIMDMKGNVLYIPAAQTFAPGPNEIEINATEAGLLPGAYFVNIEINGQVINRKIIEVR